LLAGKNRNGVLFIYGGIDMIILRLDRVMADRKMPLNELAKRIGISNANLSNIKTGKISAIRFSTLDAICEALECQPGDLLEYKPNKKEETT
jgi:putative transcriptional regulator